MFPCRKPKLPVNWAEVGRAWNPRAEHLSFVIKSCGIIGQSAYCLEFSISHSGMFHSKEKQPSPVLTFLKSLVALVRWAVCPAPCLSCSSTRFLPGPACAVSGWAGRGWSCCLHCLLLALPARQGTVRAWASGSTSGAVVLPWKPRWEISPDVEQLTEKVKQSLAESKAESCSFKPRFRKGSCSSYLFCFFY